MLKVTVDVKGSLKPLEDLARRAEALDGEHSVSLADLLNPAFLRGCSRFQSADEMFEASGFKIESPEDFKAIPDTDWDTFISSNTSFSSWEEMQAGAAKAWFAKQLGF